MKKVTLDEQKILEVHLSTLLEDERMFWRVAVLGLPLVEIVKN